MSQLPAQVNLPVEWPIARPVLMNLLNALLREVNANTGLSIQDGVTAPQTQVGVARIFVDAADGDLKIKYGDGTTKLIVADT